MQWYRCRMTPAVMFAGALFLLPSIRADVTTFARYDFEGPAGDPAPAADVSGNGRDYTNLVNGGGTYDAAPRPGSTGATSIRFANGGFYSMANLNGGLLQTNNIGFEGWFKAANDNEANVHIFGLGGNQSGMSIAQNGTNWMGLHGGIKWLTQTQAPVDTNQWIHLAVVRDNGVTKFYANGRCTGSDGGALLAPTVPHLAVNNGGAVRYDGLADDLRIFTFETNAFRMYDTTWFVGTNRNLALGKPARSNGGGMNQGATYVNPNWGTDGWNQYDSGGNFVEMTYGSTGVFFEVELATRARLSAINVLPRTGFDRRLENVRVSVFNGAVETVVGDFNTNGTPSGALRIEGLNLDVERVRVTKIGPTTGDGAPNTLNLSEVEALGVSLVSSNMPAGRLNVASVRNNPLATASQSSLYPSDGQTPVALRAIDGITDGAYANGSLTHTDDTGSPAWWQVSLGAPFVLNEVVLFNRDGFQDRLGNFKLSVLSGGVETWSTLQLDAVGASQSYAFAAVTGDTVRIEQLGPNPAGNYILSLAEVEVYQLSSTAVDIADFSASVQTGMPTVAWTTTAERDASGFWLERQDATGGWIRVNADLLPASGGPSSGASYAVSDPSAVPGSSCTYRLVVELSGGGSETTASFSRTMMQPLVFRSLTAQAGAGFRLQWQCRQGESYRVMTSMDLLTTNWFPATTGLAATPPLNEWTDPAGTNAAVYRIDVEP